MVFELIDLPGPKAQALSGYTTFDYKKEAELERFRNSHYAERNAENYVPNSVFNYRLPFLPIDPEHVLNECFLKKTAPKSLPEYTYLADYMVFSKRLKEAIEVLENGAHQFFPLKVYSHDKNDCFEYFIIHSGVRLRCVDYARSGFTHHVRPTGSEYWQLPTEPQVKYVEKSKIEGHHYWSDVTAAATFFSGELIVALGRDFLPRGQGLKEVVLV